MPSGAKTLLIILLIPFLAGLGHDIYLSYFSDDQKIQQIKRLQADPNKFMPSDLGWIWTNYHPKSMEFLRTEIKPETWATKIDPILQLPTIGAGIIPFGLGAIFLLIAFILGVWPFKRYGKHKGHDDYAVYKHAKSNSIKYTKK